MSPPACIIYKFLLKTAEVGSKKLEIDGHKFECPLKYLEHKIANPAHPYVDVQRFRNSISRVQEQMARLELKKEMEHSIGGMSM